MVATGDTDIQELGGQSEFIDAVGAIIHDS